MRCFEIWVGLMKVAVMAAVLAFAQPAAAVRSITVGMTNDTAPGTTSGTCSLRMAIERANGGSNSCAVAGTSGGWIINVPGSVNHYAISGSNAFNIRNSMTIQGQLADYTSTVVAGNPTLGGGVFVVAWGAAVTVNLKFMRITNSVDLNVDGGALTVLPANTGTSHTVNLDTVQIDNCIAWMGGAIANRGGILSVTNSYIHDNKAGYGGAIASVKDSSANGTLTITKSKLIANKADQSGGSFGGAVYMNNSGTISETTIDSNQALVNGFGGDGGGLYLHTGGSVSIVRSTVSNNKGRSGAGVYQDHPSSFRSQNSTFSGNIADVSGGGIYGENYVELFNVTITLNRAKSGTGGGVYYGSGSGSITSGCIVAINYKGTGTLKQDYCGNPHGDSSAGNPSLFGKKDPGFTYYANDLFGDPGLGALGANGGLTSTHAIGSGSIAKDADISAVPLAVDQRGTTRPKGVRNDMGSYEYVP